MLLIEGHPGIGKTALLEAVQDAAQKRGMDALPARGGELEQDLGFGLVRQLFAHRVVGERPGRGLFSGPARFAAALLGGTADEMQPASRSPMDAVSSSLHGLYWLVVNLAERRPLALLVDDGQWADAASGRFLAYLARRLDGLPVLLAVTSRPPLDGDRLFGALAGAAGAGVLSPRPLSAAAATQLIGSIAPQAGEDVCRACHQLTGGNPFFLREVGVGLAADGYATAEAKVLADWSPEGATRAVRRRLAALSACAREVARAAAVLGEGAELRHAAALFGLETSDAGAAADELRRAGLLATGRALEFVHPILRAAVYDDVLAGALGELHREAARLLADDGLPVERVAAQLFAANRTGDPWVCDQLLRAARESLAKGAPEAAVSHLRRVLDEPPPRELRFQVLFELGAAEAAAWETSAASKHLLNAYEEGRDLAQRSQAAMLYALLQYIGGRGVDGIELLLSLLEEARDDSMVAAQIEAQIVDIGAFQACTRPRVAPVARMLVDRVQNGAAVGPSALAAVAVELAMAAEPVERVVELATHALDQQAGPGGLMRDFDVSQVVRCLMAGDALDRATAILDREVESARARGSELAYAIWAALRSGAQFRRGAISEAEADARTVYELTRQTGAPAGIAASTSYLVDALVERGELDEAERIVAEAGLDGPATSLPDLYPVHLLLHSRGALRIARGKAEAGLEDVLESGRRQLGVDEVNPAFIPWRSTAALALASSGDRARADQLAHEELELARAFGAARALGIALRACALLEGGQSRRDLLEEAIEVLAPSPARLEYGRTLAALGDLLLSERHVQDANRALREALELAHVCGAAALEARVLDALHAGGARPRRAMLSGPDALTPSERRVAELAAGGMTNREVADALFVTVHTVESHLVSAFRKLGIDARGRLAEALARGRE